MFAAGSRGRGTRSRFVGQGAEGRGGESCISRQSDKAARSLPYTSLREQPTNPAHRQTMNTNQNVNNQVKNSKTKIPAAWLALIACFITAHLNGQAQAAHYQARPAPMGARPFYRPPVAWPNQRPFPQAPRPAPSYQGTGTSGNSANFHREPMPESRPQYNEPGRSETPGQGMAPSGRGSANAWNEPRMTSPAARPETNTNNPYSNQRQFENAQRVGSNASSTGWGAGQRGGGVQNAPASSGSQNPNAGQQQSNTGTSLASANGWSRGSGAGNQTQANTTSPYRDSSRNSGSATTANSTRGRSSTGSTASTATSSTTTTAAPTTTASTSTTASAAKPASTLGQTLTTAALTAGVGGVVGGLAKNLLSPSSSSGSGSSSILSTIGSAVSSAASWIGSALDFL